MSLVFFLLFLCVGLLLSAMNRSAALYQAFFNVIPHLSVLVQLKSVCFASRSPVMIILSTEFLMLLRSMMLIVEARGM